MLKNHAYIVFNYLNKHKIFRTTRLQFAVTRNKVKMDTLKKTMRRNDVLATRA